MAIRLLFTVLLFQHLVFGEDQKPNVLFIAIDDLNDWVGVFGGHPKAKTPHLDRFAEEGAVVFQNAHCPGPVCGPSRSALLSGFMPNRTGIYGNRHNMLNSELVQTHATLPEYFAKNGYTTISRGKISHAHVTSNGRDAGQWMFDEWENASGGVPVDKSTLTSRDRNLINGKPGPPSEHTKSAGSEFSWGVVKGKTEDTKDHKTAQWAAKVLADKHDNPFFLAVGLSKPHLPFYSPQEFWDRFPPDENYAPEIREDDLGDILKSDGSRHAKPTPDYLWLKQNNLINECARAYLACSSYADHCLGVIFEALRNSPHRDNTIVIVWGDHGWHLGEKLRYRKATLWSEATRAPVMVRLPGMTKRMDSPRPINLIDFYPTLIDLCRLPKKPELDGRSFVPLLFNPSQKWFPAVTVYNRGNASVHDDHWNLVRHANGTRELYDLQRDPMEWNNLAGKDDHVKVEQRLAKSLPDSWHKPLTSEDVDKKNKPKGLDRTLRTKRQTQPLQ